MPRIPNVDTPKLARDAANKEYVDRLIADLRATSGVAVQIFDYRFDATTISASDPGAGKYRYNSSIQPEATEIYLDRLTQTDFDVTILLKIISVGNRIIIQNKNLALDYQMFNLTGPGVEMPDWFLVPVAYVSGGAVFSNNEMVSFLVGMVGAPNVSV